jgi:hypothetical protein
MDEVPNTTFQQQPINQPVLYILYFPRVITFLSESLNVVTHSIGTYQIAGVSRVAATQLKLGLVKR